MCESSNITSAVQSNVYDPYPDYLESLKNRMQSITGKTVNESVPLYTTNAEGLFDLFLENLPAESRQEYTCCACRRFVDGYGGLAVIDEHGNAEPVLWDEKTAPDFFTEAVSAVRTTVLKAMVNGVFITDKKTLGRPRAGGWTHMSAETPAGAANRSKLDNAEQVMAEKAEDFKLLKTALSEYPVKAVMRAVMLLKAEALYRDKKFLGMAAWFWGVHVNLSNIKNKRNRDNVLWRAVASAPAGFCHIKTSMIGTLLDDIVAGLPLNSIKARFAEKTRPLQYQRPQAAPGAGNVAKAEEIVKKLGIERSLARRFARLDEIKKIWVPEEKSGAKDAEATDKPAGVFSHILTRQQKEVTDEQIRDYTPETTMTWIKFAENVLPSAKCIEYLIKDEPANFAALTAAFYEDAPPILRWDSLEKRNHFSSYVHAYGSRPGDWHLEPGYHKVTGVCYHPCMWDISYEPVIKCVLFILDGAKDSHYINGGNALFPETLKSELRKIRAALEAYSKSDVLQGIDDASACGIRLDYGKKWNAVFRVTADMGKVIYKLDRWD